MTTRVHLKYQTVGIGGTDIHLCTLKDRQQFSDPNDIAKDLGINDSVWSLFGVVWPSSIVLAHYIDVYETQLTLIVKVRPIVLAHYIDVYETEGKRILEVGCGIALTSLLLNKKNADISASDYNPEAGVFLERNAKLNHDNVINFERANWAENTDTLGRFDLIIGSDILYEDHHVPILASFIENHSQSSCEVILVDPGRGRKTKISTALVQHGFESEHIKPENTAYLEAPFKGYILKFWREKAMSS